MARLKDGSTVGGSEILTEGNLESLLGYLPLDPQDLTWSKLSGKPSTFTPSAHTHPWSEVTGKPTTFAPSAHTHSISDVAGLRAELDSIPELTKANVGLGNVDNVKQASKTEHDQLVSNFSTHQADLTSQEVGKGADIIGLPDPNNLFTATNVGGAMSELFTNVSDGKSLVGGAITDVDDSIVIPTDPTFQQLASAIGQISTEAYATGNIPASSWNGNRRISGLSFKPKVVLVYAGSSSRTSWRILIGSTDISFGGVTMSLGSNMYLYPPENFFDGGFEARVANGYNYTLPAMTWYAFG